MKSPLISLVLINYNYAHYIPRALEAIFAQIRLPDEIIILDDGSTDESVDVIKAYQCKIPNMIFHQNPQRLGVVGNINRGVELAKGKYLALCSSDDEILPDFIEKSVEGLEKYPLAALSGSYYAIFRNKEESRIVKRGDPLSNKKSYLTPQESLKKIQKVNAHIGGQTTLFKREALLKAGSFNADLGCLSDWFVIYTLIFRHGIYYIPEVLSKLRIHEHAYSQNKSPKNAKVYLEKVSELIESEPYRDIRDLFIKSGIIHHLGLSIYPMILQRKHRKFINKASLIGFKRQLIGLCKHKIRQWL